MSDNPIPHYRNDVGVAVVEVGATEFMCIGAAPPFDHPHVYLDMGSESDIVCGYCATVFRYRADLAPDGAAPASCVWNDDSLAIVPARTGLPA